MKKSATDLLLYRTYEELWERGEKYANQWKVKIVEYDDNHVKALVSWTEIYNVELFFRSSWLSRKCNCPVKDICKHIVATAIVWDEIRWIPKPTQKEIKTISVPLRSITRSELENAYTRPISANLDIIRMAAEEYCLGSPRPHALLPKQPKLSLTKEKIVLEEVR